MYWPSHVVRYLNAGIISTVLRLSLVCALLITCIPGWVPGKPVVAQNPQGELRTTGAPSPGLPNLDTLRSEIPAPIVLPPSVRARRCRHWDKKCKALKEDKKNSFNFWRGDRDFSSCGWSAAGN